MKEKYLVSFFYYTDLRTESIVEASNEVAALVLAMDAVSWHWVTEGKGFRVEIRLLG